MKKNIDPNNYKEIEERYESLGKELYSYIKKKGKHQRGQDKKKNKR
tara:strand:+ start:1562 stop:1699 length:138 start_codon:yes stop_codon:yes gene_type:complete